MTAGRLIARAGKRALFHPRDLTRSVLSAWWAAEDHGTARMTDDGSGLISNWVDKVGGLAITAATSARPTWAATSFNSAYPGITFDGVANCFVTTTLTTLPTGAVGGEIWLIGNIAGAGSTNGQIVGYGDGGAGTTRQLRQTTAGKFAVSNGTTNNVAAAANFNPAIVKGDWLGTAENGYLNGAGFSGNPTTTGSLNTTPTRLRIGASAGTVAGSFSPLVASDILFMTSIPATVLRQKMEGYFAWNRGMVANLPATHPYKLQAP